ncbi:isochorismatase family protein [Novosphingobium sp. HII-3]|nr:isochorismatase family protein [Novosphingobium sp. HII-3]
MQNGFVPLVVADACGERDERPHQANLFDLSKKYAEVITKDQAIALMG